MTFNADAILLKDRRQDFAGNIYVANQNLEDNRITTLSIENIELVTINEIPFDKFHENLVFRDDAQIWTNLVFKNRLNVDNLHTSGDWNGVDAESMIMKFQVNRMAANYSDHLEQLNMVGRSLVDNFKSNRDSMKVLQVPLYFLFSIKIKYDIWNRIKSYRRWPVIFVKLYR